MSNIIGYEFFIMILQSKMLWIYLFVPSHEATGNQVFHANQLHTLAVNSLSAHAWIWTVNTLRPRQNVIHFPNDIFKCIFVNETVWISIKISLKFVPKVRINNIPALVQIMAWRRPGDKPLSEPKMVSFLTHICVTRPQWVKLCHHWIK